MTTVSSDPSINHSLATSSSFVSTNQIYQPYQDEVSVHPEPDNGNLALFPQSTSTQLLNLDARMSGSRSFPIFHPNLSGPSNQWLRDQYPAEAEDYNSFDFGRSPGPLQPTPRPADAWAAFLSQMEGSPSPPTSHEHTQFIRSDFNPTDSDLQPKASHM